jgi:hypothetical protein
VVATVVTAVITGWLTKFGVIPNTAAKESPSAAPVKPFTVAVEVPANECRGWVTDSPEAFRQGTPLDNEWQAWAKKFGAVPVSERDIIVTIQGTSDAHVTIQDLRAKVLKRNPPMAGTRFYAWCGDAGAYRWTDVDLDRNPPKVSGKIDPDMLRSDRKNVEPIRFPYTVSISDAEDFWIVPQTKKCHCLWQLEMDWTSQGKKGTYIINDSGRPFQTTSTSSIIAECHYIGGDVDKSECSRKS